MTDDDSIGGGGVRTRVGWRQWRRRRLTYKCIKAGERESKISGHRCSRRPMNRTKRMTNWQNN